MPHTTPGTRQEMIQLALTLLQQTKQDKIKWTTTDADDQFLFSSTKSAILISGEFGNYDDENEGDFSLELLNRGGSVAARLMSSYEEADIAGEEKNYELLKELYLEVQNRTLEIDATLEDMHHALGMTTDSTTTSSGTEGASN